MKKLILLKHELFDNVGELLRFICNNGIVDTLILLKLIRECLIKAVKSSIYFSILKAGNWLEPVLRLSTGCVKRGHYSINFSAWFTFPVIKHLKVL